ncbi:MAG: hypothetical protein WCO93_07310 [bacterium]
MEATTKNKPTDFIENFIHSFEDQIQKIEGVFRSSEEVYDSSHVLFHSFQQSLSFLRTERSQLNMDLRENLAKNGSLRKNDYDCLMEEIYLLLDEKEKEAEKQFFLYIEDQKAMARFLRQGILDIENLEHGGSKIKIEAFKAELEKTMNTQHIKKELAKAKLLEFQDIHRKITDHLRMLLDAEAHTITCKDIKKIKKQILEEIV